MQAVVDVLDNMNESQERKDFLMGYLNRAQLTQRVFASTDGYAIVPDEEMKKLLITQAVIGKEGEKCFICYKCDDLTSLDNAKNVNMKEKLQCNHAIIASSITRKRQKTPGTPVLYWFTGEHGEIFEFLTFSSSCPWSWRTWLDF